jgi:ribosomal protein S18 acetylase RimI-like enzyme
VRGRSSIDVRRLEPGDVDALLRLVDRAGSDEHRAARAGSRAGSRADRARVADALGRDDVTTFVASCGPEPVGVVVLRSAGIVPLSEERAVHIEHLVVDPDWRRRGVAHLLLGAAAAAAEEMGADALVCATAAGDREAQRFLARLGFAPLVVQRTVSAAALRRRLATEATGGRRTTVDKVLARRRREARVRLQARPAAGR